MGPEAQPFARLRPLSVEEGSIVWPLMEAMGLTDSPQRGRARLSALVGRPDHFLPVAWCDGGPAGYAWVQDYGPHLRTGAHTARLHDLFLDPARRRAGLGAQLLRAVVAWAEAGKVRWLEWQARPAAVPFYERPGYRGDPRPDPGHPTFEIAFPSVQQMPPS